jgi:hypothetical protein
MRTSCGVIARTLVAGLMLAATASARELPNGQADVADPVASVRSAVPAVTASGERGTRQVAKRDFPQTVGGATVLFDNGPVINSPGTGPGGADESRLEDVTLGLSTFGFGHQIVEDNAVADDFTIPAGQTWDIDTITFFAYQTGSTTTSTVNDVRVQIWDGPPNAGGVVVFGDLATNRLASTIWSNAYRTLESTPGATNRPIMEVVATIDTTLDEGTYWVEWQEGGTLASGPWAPPIAILGQAVTGNGLQRLGATWGNALDLATGDPQGLPFVIEGTSGVNTSISLTKTVGTVAATCAATDSVTVASGTTVYYCYEVENTGGVTFEFHDLVDDQLGQLLDDAPVTLAPGDTFQHIESDVATVGVTNTGTWTAADSLAGYQFDDTVANGFVDISGTGTPLNLGDDGSAGVTIAFPFELYGNASDQLCISNNGHMLHGTLTCPSPFTNEALPSAGMGGAGIAVYWDDLDSESGNVFHQGFGAAPNRTHIVQWHQRPHFPGPNANTVTFQVVLHETSNEVEFFYQDTTFGDPATDNGASATVGLQQSSTVANQYSFNTPGSIVDTEAIHAALGTVVEASAADTATVSIADPDIVVDPTSLSSTQLPDTQNVLQMDIDNIGVGDLVWDITESSVLTGERPVVLAPGRQELIRTQTRWAGPRPNPAGVASHSFSGAVSDLTGKVYAAPRPEVPAGTVTITHSATQNIVSGNSVSCNAGGLHTNNSYLRAFDLGSFGITTDFDVVQVEVGVEQAIGATGSQPVTVNLYTWNPADPFIFANFTQIGTANASVADQSLTILAVPVTGTAPAGSTLVVELFTPDGQTTNNSFFVGSNPDGQTAPTFLAAADCGVAEPTDTAAIGFPNMHMVMNVSGTTGCNEDLTWVSTSPSSGTTPAAGTSTVDVTFDSTGLAGGDVLTGSLCVNSNDPDTSTLLVPITLTVDTMPFIDGFETGDTSRWSATQN